MESSSSSSNTASNSIAKKLLHMFKVVYYMLRKGIISKRKLMMDLHLLLKRGKLAGKALGNLMTSHGHGHHHTDCSSSSAYSSSSFSCRSMDPNLSFYNPREVEFSCSNTPSYPVNITRRKNHHHRSNKNHYSYDSEAVAAVAKAFEMLNNNNNMGEVSDSESVLPSPSPMIAFGKSPAKMVRQLRITDSPYPIKEEEEVVADGRVDKEAEEFIRRFYEQLRMQPATPEYTRLRRGA